MGKQQAYQKNFKKHYFTGERKINHFTIKFLNVILLFQFLTEYMEVEYFYLFSALVESIALML